VKSVAPPQAAPAPVPPPAPVEPRAEVKPPEVKLEPPARKEKKAREKAVRRAEPVAAPAEATAPIAPAEPGVVAFAISPWGEIFVDGKSQGVSPPLQQLQLSPGRHRVEVRNSSFTPHVQIVEVKSGERIRIRHRFQ
jgi:hypothetical protein